MAIEANVSELWAIMGDWILLFVFPFSSCSALYFCPQLSSCQPPLFGIVDPDVVVPQLLKLHICRVYSRHKGIHRQDLQNNLIHNTRKVLLQLGYLLPPLL